METYHTIAVQKEDIDILGHVNNSKYVVYLADARVDWYNKVGLTDEMKRERKIGAVVLKLDVLFKKEAKLGEVLKVKTCPLNLGTKSFELKRDIYVIEEIACHFKVWK